MRRIGRLTLASTTVAAAVFRRMNFHEWGRYLRERTSVDRDLAVRLGQDVRGY